MPELKWRIPTRLDVLRDILSQYPDDGQILKEIIQNGEDAGAKHVKFIYDKHEYSKEGLDPKLAKFQGPALYAYNDAVFTDEDFANLLNIQHSSKREDRTKVGRFGRGFKSVFHMTEMPTLLSGAYFGRVNPYNDNEPCLSLPEVLPAEFESFYGKFGFNAGLAKNGHYPGTIFRFPLRKERSDLSDTLYGEEKIKELFRMLEADSHMNLLFLKSLVSIEVYIREVKDKTSEGVLKFSIQLKHISIGLDERQGFFRGLGMAAGEVLEKERKLTYQVDFKKCVRTDSNDLERFVVCHYYNGKKETQTMKKLLEDPNLSYLPLVSVAMPINTDEQTIAGQLFCFLPLPLHDNTSPTGLPIHVNSFFVVSSNRSEIKWPTTGQNVDKMTKDLQWNRCLITELLPQAYAHLLQDATALPDVHPHDICSAFPDINRVNEKWKDTLLPPFLKQVHLLPIFPTSGTAVTRYVCLKDAVLCPPSVGPAARTTLVKFLVDAGRNPVCVPEYITRAVKSHSPRSQVTEATPMFLCQLLKQCKKYQSYSRDNKLQLLHHLLSEPDDVADDMYSIQLLPLANQTFTEFDKDGSTIYIATNEERALLPTLQHMFLRHDLDPSLSEKLTDETVMNNTQLSILREEDVLCMLPQIFPRLKRGDSKILKLKPGKEPALSHLTTDWCEKLWHFFTRIREDHPDHLDKVRHLHLLPIVNTPSDFHLTRLSGGAVCIAASLHNEALPADVSKALPYFGVHILHEIPNVIRHHPYVFNDGFVHQPNAVSVMQALVKMYEDNTNICNQFNSSSTNDQKRALLVFLEPLRLVETTLNCKPLLQKLQLFETIDGSGHKSKHPASLAVVQNGVTSYKIPVKPNSELLDLSSLDSLLMAKFIGVNVMSETTIIEKYILEDIRQRVFDEGDIRRVMVYVLNDLRVHTENSDTIMNTLKDLAFLEDEESHYRKPGELFDPDDALLKKLFAGENKFPSKHYYRLLGPLRTLGLKSRSQVTVEDLNHSAALVHKAVQDLKQSGRESGNKVAELKAKSQAIASIFLENLSMKTNPKVRRLRELEWVPVQTDKPKSYPKKLPWNPEEKLFEKPGFLALTTSTSVIASSLAIVDSIHVPDMALEAICGALTSPCAKVVEHLRNLSQCYSTHDKPKVMAMVQDVYKVMEGYDVRVIRKELSEWNLTDWVWQGDGFTSVECVAISQQFNENLSPYAYTLPKELATFHDWLLKMGIKGECDPVEILHRMKDWHENPRNIATETANHDQPKVGNLFNIFRKIKDWHVGKSPADRVNHDRSIAVNLINKIVESHPSGVPESIREELVLPIESSEGHLILLPASSCTYHDKDWKLGEVIDVEQVSQEDDETLHLLHRSISKATATAIGVATLMNRLLEGDCEGFEFAAEFEGHGQEESLTHRLKHLLQDYPDGLAIPKELIQNADDAGATQIKFLFDERENEDAMTGLLDEGMKQCQGPALWIYNNAEFADEDLANIRKLSGATKEDKKDKIGKFGLGFNAVYNVTDVPSFVTREYVVFFDPHRSHLGKAMPRNDTGLKVNLCTGSKRVAEIRKQLFNQFKTYHGVFGCQMEKFGDHKPYPGTLFRLPLRKPGTVSEIKNVPYSREDMVELLQLLVDKADEMLLFTQNVKKIEVYHLPMNIRDPTYSVKLYTAERNVVNTLKSLPSPLCPCPGERSNLLMISKSMTAQMPQQYPNGLHVAERVITTIELDDGMSISKLGLHSRPRAVHWLLYGCFGLGKSFSLAVRSSSEVPVAGVAVKLQQDGDTFQAIPLDSAPVYCHLPLPSSVKSGLPVIVNGCFAVKPDRRHLVELTSDDKKSAMNRWNKHLQEDVITEAYLGALELMAREAHTQGDLYSLWPSQGCTDKQFQTFHNTFYTCLKSKSGRWSPKIFTNGKTWVNFKHAVFLDKLLIASAEMKEVALNRLQSHLDRYPGDLVVVDLPGTLMNELGDMAEKTIDITQFFREAVLPYIGSLDPQERDSLLHFGLQCTQKNKPLKELFQQSSCIPLRPDGKRFAKPCDLVSPTGYCADLFDTEDGVFPTANFCSKKWLGYLEDMGMRVNAISWECIIERANSVQRQTLAKSMERTKHILSYIARQHDLGTESTANSLEKLTPLKQIKFLPVMGRPGNYPQRLCWKGDSMDQVLVAAVDLYLPKHQRLIGCTCLLLDEQRSANRLRTPRSRQFLELVLGLDEKKPKACDVLIQLLGVSEHGANCVEIQSICTELCSYLNSCCSGQIPDIVAMIFKELGDTKCILVGDHFMNPKHCAVVYDKEAPPFLSKVPYRMCQFKSLLAALKVKQSFEPIDFIEALHRIGAQVDISVHTVRDIAESLHKQLTEKGKSIEDVMQGCSKPVLLPSAPDEDTSIWELLPVSRLCLNLYPWLKKPVSDQSLKYVHTAITPEVAKALGVKTDGENLFEALGCQFGEPFGQKEKLTTRIKNILEGYPCDEGILKELLQNADDAGASELRFILDTGTHGGEKIFHHKWKDMQGPALCVYNNRPFTKDDLKGICSLGQGSKSSDTTKTGQYGIGFNCVYHLTDVPSFMTDVEGIGKTVCFFDPNCNHVPGATADNPGRSYQGDRLLKMTNIFPDMCQGYLEDRFQNLDGATMFRLPLRTANVAKASDISEKEVTVQTVEHLMDAFKKELFYSLLFVNNVRCVCLEKMGNTEEPYQVDARLSDVDQAALLKFNAYVKQVATQLRKKKVHLENVKYKEVIYTLTLSDSKSREETWSVCQCIGFKNANVPPVVAEAVRMGDIALLPRGGVAYRILDQTLHRLFCFLPLPVDTPLPVHVNGHFALDSSRRALWNDVKEKTSGYKQAWNTMLMEQVVSHAYISLVSRRCNQLFSNGDAEELTSFYRMFPVLQEANSGFIQSLREAFYTILKTNDLRFLAVKIPTTDNIESRWFSVQQCVQGQAFFDNTKVSVYHPNMAQPNIMGHQAHTIGGILCGIGFNLLAEQVPQFIHDALLLVKASVPEVEPSRVLTFLEGYKDNASCKLRNLPIDAKQSPFRSISSVVRLIQYCFPGNGPPMSLQGLPLCITQDGILQQFQTVADIFVPAFSLLLPKHRDKFLHASVFHAIPTDVIETTPRCVQQLSVEKLVPFLKTDYNELLVEYRQGWDPYNKEAGLGHWIQTLWDLIQQELRESSDNKIGMMKRLTLLKDFCIVPVTVSVLTNSRVVTTYREAYYLYPLKDAGCVIGTSTSSFPHDQSIQLQEILRNAGVPILIDVSACGSRHDVGPPRQGVLQKLVSNVRDARGILEALSSLLLHDPSAQQLKITITQNPKTSWEIVKYLSGSLKYKCTQEEADLFLALPIHQITNGGVVPLQNSCVYLVPTDIPKAGLDNWFREGKNSPEVFIFKRDEDVCRMYENIGAIEMTVVDLYVELILLDFNFQDYFDEKDRQDHLRYIKEKVLPSEISNREKGALLAKLQNLPFLKDVNGEFRRTSEFFNPLEPLFLAMETLFPPQAFHRDHWIKFLSECGLHSCVTGEDLVRYATQVAEEGKNPQKDTERKAILICKKLPAFAHKEAVLFQIKDIQFLPIGKVWQQLSTLCPQYGVDKQDKYISFQNSAFFTESEYCWTVAKILPRWLHYNHIQLGYVQRLVGGIFGEPRVELDKGVATALGIRCPVPVEVVVTHCIKLVRTLSNNQWDPHSMKNAMDLLYKFFADKSKEISKGDIKKLAREPLIAVDDGKNLIRPSQIVVGGFNNTTHPPISPYLYMLPNDLWKYIEFFLEIEVEQEVNCKHYMNVLHLIHETCRCSKENVRQLDPKQLQAAVKATRGFFHLLHTSKKQLPSDACLYLLSRQDTLERSPELVRVNKPSWETQGRIDKISTQLLLLNEKQSLQYSYQNGLHKLPQTLQPKLLSHLVEEDIDESCMESVQDMSALEQHTKRITSEEFREGLKRLLHQALEVDSRANFEEYWTQLEDGLTHLTFYSVNELRTVLKIKRGDDSHVLENSTYRHANGIFTKTFSDMMGARVYIEKGTKHISKSGRFLETFTDIVSKVFPPKVVDSIKTHLIWLFQWDISEISSRLDEEDIPQILHYDNDEPPLGELIPVGLHGILKQDVGVFDIDDIVGFKTSDPLGEGNEGSEEFVYAKVLAHAGSKGVGDAFQMYEIDIGERQVVVFAMNIYKFHRDKLTSEEMVMDLNYDIQEVHAQITRDIDFAYEKLSAEERCTWIIRTISKWQPDSNPGHEDTCKRVLKVIQDKIDEEEAKIPEGALQGETAEAHEARKLAYNVQQVIEYTARRAREKKNHIQAQRKWLESNSKMSNSLKDSTNYDYFRLMKIADHSRKTCGKNAPTFSSQSFYDHAYQQYERQHMSYSGYRATISVRPAYHVPSPRPHEARQWFRQAEGDLDASRNDVTTTTKQAYEWAIFKCYKAAEKALKAAYFTKDSDNFSSQDLVNLASRLGDSELSSLATRITAITGDCSSLQYPAQGALQIPRELHRRNSYTTVYDLAELLLQRVKSQFLS